MSIFPNGVGRAMAERASFRTEMLSSQRTAPSSSTAPTRAQFEAAFYGLNSGYYSGLVSKEQAFQESAWLQPSCHLFAASLARMPFRMFRENGNDKQRLTKHKLIDLMARPNQAAKISEYTLKYITFFLYDFDGEVFWHLGYNSKSSEFPDFITPFGRHGTRAVMGNNREHIGWEFTIEGVPYFADRSDVIHFPQFNPIWYRPDFNPFTQMMTEPRRGRSGLESKRLSITADLSAAHYQQQWFGRGIAPNMVFFDEQDSIPAGGEDAFRDKLRSRLAGKNGEPLILSGPGWKVESLMATQKDAEFSQSRAIAREEQLAGRSLPVLMGKDDASYANANVQLFVFYDIILGPINEFFCTQLDANLLGDEPDVYCVLSTDGIDVLQEAKRNRLKAATELEKEGMPWDDAARLTGVEMEPFEGSDVSFRHYTDIPTTDILAGSSKAEIATAPPATAPKPPDVVPPIDKPNLADDPEAPRFYVLAPPSLRVLVTEDRMAGPFDYQSTQINLTGDAASKILAMAAAIPDDALAEKGREIDPHVTVKYGLDPSVTVDQVREALANSDSVLEMVERGGGTLTFGPTTFFALDDYDAVYIAIDSPDLVLLNDVIANGNLPVTNTHGDYVPHATLAYVASGRGEEFAGNDALDGTTVRFTKVQFSDNEGRLTPISLADAVATRRARVTRRGRPNISVRSATDDTTDALSGIIGADDSELQDIARKFHVEAIKLGSQQIGDLLLDKNTGDQTTTLLPIDSPYVREFLDTRANLITSVNKTTGDQIIKAIQTGMNNGDSPEVIAKGIRDVYNIRKSDADFIARQENGSALNGGRFLQLQDMGSEADEWLSCRDDQVRATHAPGTGVDGEIVALGEMFSNGCRYPQDPKGDKSEVLGCRCVVMPARLDGTRMIVAQAQRDAYHRAAVVVGLRNADRRFASRLGRYFNDQRGRVLGEWAKRMGA